MSVQETYLKEIADAIRTKYSSSEEIQASQFAEYILNIPVGSAGGGGGGVILAGWSCLAPVKAQVAEGL